MHSKLDGNQYGITIFRCPQQEDENGNKAGADEDDGDGVDILFCCRRQTHLIAMWRS